MLGAYGSLVGQAEVYLRCVSVEGSGTGSKYIVAPEFLPEVINCAIVLVVVVVVILALLFSLILVSASELRLPSPLLFLLDLDGICLIRRHFKSGS